MQAIDNAINFSNAVLTSCGEDADELSLQVSNGRFYVGEEKILHGKTTAALIQVMLDCFVKRQLSGFTFFSTIKSASHTDILTFARLVNEARFKDAPSDWLKNKLIEKAFSWVEIFTPVQESIDPETPWESDNKSSVEEIRRERARKTYSYGLSNLKEVALKLGAGQRVGISKSVRLVQNMVNLLNDDESVLLSLSTLRIYDDYTYSHSVNVALLAMSIGKRIGLSNRALEKLGLCGLFHDLGKVSIPDDITKKPGKLSPRELSIMHTHSLHSVRQIVMLRAPRTRTAQLILPAFEHHMKFDHSGGYPRSSTWEISLFGRIITIVDVFDAITSPRVYRKSSMSPDRALGYMMNKVGEDFDPILLKVFVNMLGFYPPGTVVVLDNEEIGLVIDTPAENHGSGLPRVMIMIPDGDNGFTKGATINLAEQSPETGASRKIIRTAHPAVYNIQPAQYLF
jgi:HD-GYP domain-containing protein (c-di-GMP phosphodiesterase class II)